jgi:hypothetical protein
MVKINARTRIVMSTGDVHVIDFHVEDALALVEKAAKGAQMMGLDVRQYGDEQSWKRVWVNPRQIVQMEAW